MSDETTPNTAETTATAPTPTYTAADLSELTVEWHKPTKLSEAIRLGCVFAPHQGYGDYMYRDGAGNFCACALGAAHIGLHGYVPRSELLYPTHDGPLYDAFGITFNMKLPMPPEARGRMHEGTVLESDTAVSVSWGVAFLNDTLRWPREKVADWLERHGL